jgi:DNA-directed RNA polymerase specialized sigma24 family protein
MSAILEISVSAVTTRLSRAIKALAKEMNKGEENGI